MTAASAGVLVNTQAAWAAAGPRIAAAERLALDLEADGFHRYPEQTALLQLALPDGSVLLLDPLALPDLDALGAALADPAVPIIVHSSSYDVRALDRDFDFHIAGLVDTSIAAQLAGSTQLGLGNVLLEVLGVDLPKPKRLQRFDWSRRPLPDEALDYAAGDVIHLLALADALTARLAALGRLAWLDEECRRAESARHEPPVPPAEAFWRVRGARELTPPARAVLRELVVYRDSEALRVGRPPHHVLSNEALIAIASRPDERLERVGGVGAAVRGAGRERLRAAIQRGRDAGPVHWPRRTATNPWTPAARERLLELKTWRKGEAARLGLDPGIIWPMGHLERLALHPAAPLADLDDPDAPGVRRWQWAELGASLDAFRCARAWQADQAAD
ncbi:MAG: HRDC domain-containing protein [Ardenticatenales bacterium]|nr:HRDC domain-containing protein [Ardenticatenales bacterium]